LIQHWDDSGRSANSDRLSRLSLPSAKSPVFSNASCESRLWGIEVQLLAIQEFVSKERALLCLVVLAVLYQVAVNVWRLFVC
jgi:hypothetical protein